jgi:SAM-dependent methyltransferase
MEMCRDCRLVWARKQYFGAPVYSEGREEAIYGGGKTALFRGCLKTLAKRFPGRGNLLDVGSAYGVFLGMAKTDGWNAEGIEVDPKTASSASAAGFKVHNRPIDELGLPAAYNVVTVFEVFCLMSEPLKAAVEMYRVLIPDGRIYIREFNGAFHMALEGRRIFKILGIRPSIVHNFNFTAESLRRMLARAGFKNIKIRNSRPTNGDPYGTGGRMGAALTGLAKNLYYYAAQLVYFASLGRLHVGSSFIIEAKK